MLPAILPAVKIAARVPRGSRATVRSLCRDAGIECRVTGPAAERVIYLVPPKKTASREVSVVREPGAYGAVSIGLSQARGSQRGFAPGVFDPARGSQRVFDPARGSQRVFDPARGSQTRGSQTRGSQIQERAILALGILAYSVLDYAARESMRGRPEARMSPPRGRPRKVRALSGAERQRRWREAQAQPRPT